MIPAGLIKMINKSCCLASFSHAFQSVHVVRGMTVGLLEETHIHTEDHDGVCHFYNNLQLYNECNGCFLDIVKLLKSVLLQC